MGAETKLKERNTVVYQLRETDDLLRSMRDNGDPVQDFQQVLSIRDGLVEKCRELGVESWCFHPTKDNSWLVGK